MLKPINQSIVLNLFQYLSFRVNSWGNLNAWFISVNLFLIFIPFFSVNECFGQQQTQPDFQWGNASYFNLNKGESLTFQDTEVKLLQLKNHFNQFKIGYDTVWLKVSRRTLPETLNGLRIFVADNKNVKALTDDDDVHGLLKKDVLLCLSNSMQQLFDPGDYVFPISFNDGFLWSVEEDSYMFSYNKKTDNKHGLHSGIDIDLQEARGKEKHWVVALENSRVVWVKDKNLDGANKEACVLLESASQAGIYYVYNYLYNKNVVVKAGDKLTRGEPIGTIWGDEIWGHLNFSVIKSDSVPTYGSRNFNAINFFPQLYGLYFRQTYKFNRNYTKGKISFGLRKDLNGNKKNILAFEAYSGKGWELEKWNTADKVDFVSKGKAGNARLCKKMFMGEKASCTNPNNWYDYEINVRNGVYRIRAKMGDQFLPTWQKVVFEGVNAAIYTLQAGELKWTPEKVVKVKDGKLTVRIFVDEKKNTTAGLSEIVFQQAY